MFSWISASLRNVRRTFAAPTRQPSRRYRPTLDRLEDRYAPATAASYQNFLLHTGTALGQTGANWDFKLVDWNRDGTLDLFGIQKNTTGTNTTEVHVLDGGTNFQTFLLHTGTALGQTGGTFDFDVVDWNQDGVLDVVAIQKEQTGSGRTELHILNGASNFQNFLLRRATALGPSGGNHVFKMADWDRDGVLDLVAIQQNQTGSRTTEVHILSGATTYRTFLLNTGTALGQTGENYAFDVADWNGDGVLDLVAIQQNQTGSNTTELQILNGAATFQNFLLLTGTALGQTGENFDFQMADFNRDGDLDVVAIQKNQTGSNTTELHILGQAAVNGIRTQTQNQPVGSRTNGTGTTDAQARQQARERAARERAQRARAVRLALLRAARRRAQLEQARLASSAAER
jgi:hypothetical protein